MISLGRLQFLYLFNNQLGSDGFRHVAPALRHQRTLIELDLGGNGANEASVVDLLSVLAIAHNDNDDDAAVPAVPGGMLLQVLVLGGNETGDQVEQMVAQVQQLHPGLDIARDKKAQRRTT